MVRLKLGDIPQVINVETVNFELRGVVNLKMGKRRLLDTVGYYLSYLKRGNRLWETHDDFKNKAIPVKDTTHVECEFILYTV